MFRRIMVGKISYPIVVLVRYKMLIIVGNAALSRIWLFGFFITSGCYKEFRLVRLQARIALLVLGRLEIGRGRN